MMLGQDFAFFSEARKLITYCMTKKQTRFYFMKHEKWIGPSLVSVWYPSSNFKNSFDLWNSHKWTILDSKQQSSPKDAKFASPLQTHITLQDDTRGSVFTKKLNSCSKPVSYTLKIPCHHQISRASTFLSNRWSNLLNQPMTDRREHSGKPLENKPYSFQFHVVLLVAQKWHTSPLRKSMTLSRYSYWPWITPNAPHSFEDIIEMAKMFLLTLYQH